MSLNTKQDQCALSVNHQLAFKITKLWLTGVLQMFSGVQHVKDLKTKWTTTAGVCRKLSRMFWNELERKTLIFMFFMTSLKSSNHKKN